MYLARVISKTAFDIASLTISVSPHRWTPPSVYDDLVTTEWQKLLVRTPQPIWDGTYYRVLNPADLENGTEPLTVRLGTIRYRFIATFPLLHQAHAHHQLEPLHHLSTIALLRTSDGYYLFGRRTRNREIDLIGGGVQKDELEIASGADLERNLIKEIHEETGISRNRIDRLSGIGILLSGTSNVLMVGHAHVDPTRAEAIAAFALRTENEMSEAVFIPGNELPCFLRSKSDYRPLIPQLMELRPAAGLQ